MILNCRILHPAGAPCMQKSQKQTNHLRRYLDFQGGLESRILVIHRDIHLLQFPRRFTLKQTRVFIFLPFL